jgi:hypothetical protein
MISTLFYFIKIFIYSFVHLIRILIYYIDNIYFKVLPNTIEYKNKLDKNYLNSNSNVFIPGFGGYPMQELINIPYWNSIKYSGYYLNILTPKISPMTLSRLKSGVSLYY